MFDDIPINNPERDKAWAKAWDAGFKAGKEDMK